MKGAPSATVTSVELVGDPGVSLTGAMLAGPGEAWAPFRSSTPGHRETVTWTSRGLVPAVGATITDDPAGWELLVGMTAAEAGTVDRLGINVGYDVAGVQHETFLPAFVRICVPREAPAASEKCAPPADWLARQADRRLPLGTRTVPRCPVSTGRVPQSARSAKYDRAPTSVSGARCGAPPVGLEPTTLRLTVECSAS